MTHHPAAFDLPRPHDVDSEQQLLGELMLNNAAAERLTGLLAPEHFAEPLHRRIYDAIARAVKAGLAATPNTLKAEFESDEAMRTVGGVVYLAELAGRGPECVDTMAWAQSLKNLAFRRALIATAREMQDVAFRTGIETEPHEIAERAEELLAQALSDTSGPAADRFRAVGDLAHAVIGITTDVASWHDTYC